MEREFRRLCRGLTLLACILCWRDASAQNRVPPPPPAAGIPGDEPIVPAREPSPLAAEPKTPADLLEATVLMVEIARPDLAAAYFEKLVSLDLDDEALLALRDRFGVVPFLRLTNVKELKISAEKLLDRVNAAAARRAVDPERVVRLLAQLDGDDPEERAAGESELRALGPLVVPGILSVLANPDQAKHHESALVTLVQVGDSAVPLLLGALSCPNEDLRASVIMVLGRLRSPKAAPYLWYHALSSKESPGVRAAARLALARIFKTSEAGVDRIASEGTISKLTKLAAEHYRHEFPWTTDAAGRVTLWSWNDERKTVVPATYSPEEASDLTGLQFARQALALAPDNRKVQVLYLSLALVADFGRGGFDKPLPTGPGTAYDLALSAGPAVAADVLAESLAASRPMGAVAALKVLDQIGTRAQLAGADGKRSPIVAALDFPDPRVQFAAATTILQFDPAAGFRGAPRVVEVLKRAAAAGSKPQAVVGEISTDRGAQIGGFLRDLGYEPLVFVNGREAFRAAAERADVEFVVLHPNIIRWTLSETLANLRADSRTAGIPIVIHGPGDLQPRLQSHVRNYRLVSFATLTEVTADFEHQVQPFLHQVKTPPMNDQQRVALRRGAVAWFAHIATGRRTGVFDITSAQGVLIDALADPALAAIALEALGEIPTPAVQRRIAETVLDSQAALEVRQTAASKLAFHMQRFGLLLSRESIAELHRVWSDEQQPAPLRTALGGVIGSLKPDATLVGKRLQAFPVE